MSEILHRFLATKPASLDMKARTFEAVFATNAPYRRHGPAPDDSDEPWSEVLDPAGADLTRVQAGVAAFLQDHRPDQHRGIVESARVVGGELVGTIRVGPGEESDRLLEMIASGTRNALSVGYVPGGWQKGADRSFTAREWLLYEVSSVSIPADSGARVRTLEIEHMTTAPAAGAEVAAGIAAERARAASILTLSTRHGVPDLAQAAIDAGTTADDFRGQVLDELARRDAQHPTDGTLRVEFGTDHGSPEAISKRAVDALASRISGTAPPEHAKELRSLRLPALVGWCMEQRGIKVPRYATDRQVIDLARRSPVFGTGDLPLLLANALHKAMMPVYQIARSPMQTLVSRETVSDFKENKRLRPSDFPALKPVMEHGEYTYGSITERQEVFTIGKYGRIFGYSWEAMVNDDLDALTAVAGTTARAATALENNLVAAKFETPGTLSDSVAVFDTSRGNYMATGPLATSTSLPAAIVLLRRQKTMDAENYITLSPRYLAVAPEQELTARQLLQSTAVAVAVADRPVYQDLELLVDPRITSPVWYLAPDPAVQKNLILANLDENAEGPYIETKTEFDVDAMAIKVRHTVGVAWVDHRLVKSMGA